MVNIHGWFSFPKNRVVDPPSMDGVAERLEGVGAAIWGWIPPGSLYISTS